MKSKYDFKYLKLENKLIFIKEKEFFFFNIIIKKNFYI
jgi:hypothetical protein